MRQMVLALALFAALVVSLSRADASSSRHSESHDDASKRVVFLVMLPTPTATPRATAAPRPTATPHPVVQVGKPIVRGILQLPWESAIRDVITAIRVCWETPTEPWWEYPPQTREDLWSKMECLIDRAMEIADKYRGKDNIHVP